LDLRGNYKKKLHTEGLHNLNSLSNIIQVIKSNRMRLTGHVARIAELRLKGRDHLGDLDIDGRITLK
jgi:hypothetical protein